MYQRGMELNDKGMDWLKEAPTLAAIRRESPFTVPSGYFNRLTDRLNSQVLVESMRFDKEEEFNVPVNYFKDLSPRIENRIAIENIQNLVPSEGYIVPDTYFSQLSDRINSRLDEDRSTIIRKRSIFSSWISYSAAASVAMLIGTVIYFNSSDYTINKQLSAVPDEEIVNYLQVYSTIGDTPVIIENLNTEGLQQVTSDVSSEELEQYINNTTL